MKSRLISVITNGVLILTLLAVSLIGFAGKGAVAVSGSGDNVYNCAENGCGVSLMFNVYENTSNVEKILSILAENDATATFFIGGCWADDNVDAVRKIYSDGHEVASHGYFHKDHSRMSLEDNLQEIRPGVKLLNMICGDEIKLFAPPSGAFGENTVAACAELGLKVIMWSRDTVDWRDDDRGIVFTRATQQLKNGEFILMHPKDCTVEALPEILSYIRENGLRTVTVSRNLGE